MLKRYILILGLVIILLLPTMAIIQASAPNIDKNQISSGIIKINYKSEKDATTAVRIVKGNQKQDHILGGNNRFPLQFGEGDYIITVLENAGGKKFRQMDTEVVTFKPVNKIDIYMQSVQMVNWDKDMDAVKKARELTEDIKTDREKAIAIYDYIVGNIIYDGNKANSVQAGYVPSIDETLKIGQAICYDYATIFAGMTRSLGIPTKLIMGRKNDIKDYHAWNQVYLQDTNEWITIDTTYDARMKESNVETTMIKDAKEYKVEREY